MASDRQVWVVGAGFLGSALAAACRAAGEGGVTIDPVAESDVQGSAAEKPVLQQALAICDRASLQAILGLADRVETCRRSLLRNANVRLSLITLFLMNH